ncbi:hypothetical protein C0991_010441 [Blastosporella zonata]|nr:hypothetical protein C0991_010441 [Blastosporella zonata]
MPNAFGTQQDGIIKVVVRMGAIPECFSCMKNERNFESLFFLAFFETKEGTLAMD